MATRVRQQHGFSDEPGEPENHGQEFGVQDAELVRGCGEASRRDDEVCEREDRPYRAEEEEGVF